MVDTAPLSETSPFPSIAGTLRRTVAAAMPILRALSDAEAARPRAAGKWSAKQTLGHLVDSASNNHQRFVRAQQGPLTFPPYAQDHWVACQHYNDRPWEDLVVLWHAYNQHVAHVIEKIPDASRRVPCTVETGAPVTLGFLAADYVAHLRHHLGQLKATT